MPLRGIWAMSLGQQKSAVWVKNLSAATSASLNNLTVPSLLLFAGMAAGTRLTNNVHACRLAGATVAACGIVLATQTL